jgi:hypothetical protein
MEEAMVLQGGEAVLRTKFRHAVSELARLTSF